MDEYERIIRLKFWTIERIIRIKTDQTILSLLVGSIERAVAFFGDEVRPVHLPPGKEEEGTALPPDEPNQTLSGWFSGVDESYLMDSG